MNAWHIIQSGPGEAAWNMAFDEMLLEWSRLIASPILRFYSWTEPAATFGYFQRYKEIADWTQLRPLIRRPTGGGLVPHDADWTYSVIIPPNHDWYELRAADSYRRLHEWIVASLKTIGAPAELALAARKELPGQCFAGPEQYDVLYGGRKIAGAAQRRAKEGLLIQGSIQTIPAHFKRPLWEQAMISMGMKSILFTPGDEMLGRAAELVASKYSQRSHNERR